MRRALSANQPSEDIEERSDESEDDLNEMKKSSESGRSKESYKSLGSISTDQSLVQDELDRIIMEKYAQRMLSWDNLSLWDKVSLFKMWMLVTFAGDLCIIFGTLAFYWSNYFDLSISETSIGFGAFLIWASAVQYFENTPYQYTILRTLAVAFPEILKVLIGFLPIMLGSAFLCMTLFYDYW